jgi:hypothetical protein
MQKELPASREGSAADVDDREARLDARERCLDRRESVPAARGTQVQELLFHAGKRDKEAPDRHG